MSTGIGRKKLSLNTMSVSLGCSCSRPKLSLLFFHPKTRLKTTQKLHKRQQNQYSSPSSWTNDDDEASTTTTTTTSTASKTSSVLNPISPVSPAPSKRVKSQKPKRKEKNDGRGFGRVGGEGVAVEKDSDDPYLDFRHSMLQMILENQIYSKNDMRELLNCFLQLNAPSHHGVIVSAFTEIWNGVFSVRSAGFPPPRRHDAVNDANATYQYGQCNNNDYTGNGNDANVSRDYYYY